MYKIKIPILRGKIHTNMTNPLYIDGDHYIKECNNTIEEHRDTLQNIIGEEEYISTIKKYIEFTGNTNVTFMYVNFTITEEQLFYIKLLSDDLYPYLVPNQSITTQ